MKQETQVLVHMDKNTNNTNHLKKIKYYDVLFDFTVNF